MKTSLFAVFDSQKSKGWTAGLVFSSLGPVWLQSFCGLETRLTNTNCWSLGPLIECVWWSSSCRYWVEFTSHHRWVGFVWICHQWCRFIVVGCDSSGFIMVGFNGIGCHWVGLACVGSACVSPSLLLLALHCCHWSSWGWHCLLLSWIPLVWSSNYHGFPLLRCFVFLYFTTLFSHPPPSPFPFSCPLFPSPSHPHPFGKGRGSWGCNLASEGAETLLREPTSLNRGEGLMGGFFGVFGDNLWWEGQGWWWKTEGRWMKVNHNGVNGGLKLHLPSQIMLDMSICGLNNKIKNCIIL